MASSSVLASSALPASIASLTSFRLPHTSARPELWPPQKASRFATSCACVTTPASQRQGAGSRTARLFGLPDMTAAFAPPPPPPPPPRAEPPPPPAAAPARAPPSVEEPQPMAAAPRRTLIRG